MNSKKLNNREIEQLNKKIKKVFEQLPINYNFDIFYKFLNNLPREIVFEDLINAPEQNILPVMFNLLKKEE